MKGNGLSFPFILAFWVFISFHFLSKMKGNEGPQGQMKGNEASKGQNERMKAQKAKMKGNEGPQGQMKGNESQKGKKMQNAPGLAADKICFNLIRKRIVFGNFWGGRAPHKEFNILAFSASFLCILAFWAFIFSFWPFEHSILTGATATKPPTGRPRSKPLGHQTWRKLHAYGSSFEKPPKGRPKPKPMAHQTWRKFRKTANGQTKVQTYGPPNLEKITCLRQQLRKTAKGQTEAQAHGPSNLEKIPQNRQRADQGPNLWATKPGENYMLTAAASKNRQRADRSPSPWPIKPGENSAKPPTGRPRSKPMGHQTWRKSHAYGSSVEKTATGQTQVQTHGPPNLEKIARLRQQWRRDRQRADQCPFSISQLTCFR